MPALTHSFLFSVPQKHNWFNRLFSLIFALLHHTSSQTKQSFTFLSLSYSSMISVSQNIKKRASSEKYFNPNTRLTTLKI